MNIIHFISLYLSASSLMFLWLFVSDNDFPFAREVRSYRGIEEFSSGLMASIIIALMWPLMIALDFYKWMENRP